MEFWHVLHSDIEAFIAHFKERFSIDWNFLTTEVFLEFSVIFYCNKNLLMRNGVTG